MTFKFQHWGVDVKPGETVKCDPGEFYSVISQIAIQDGKGNEIVEVFVEVDGKRLLIGTLSVDRHPQYATELVFEKKFEFLHTSKTRNISIIGYKFHELERKSSISAKEDEEPGEVPFSISLHSNANEKLAATQSSQPKVALEETYNPGKLKADAGGSGDDDNDEDDDGSEQTESGDDKNAKGKNRSVETPLKTPPEKKPKRGNKIGSVTGKRSGHVHVATPYPSKQVKKTPSINDDSKQSSGYACKSCSNQDVQLLHRCENSLQGEEACSLQVTRSVLDKPGFDNFNFS
ncbi:hypothetical protein ACP4OV_030182 [Aristida adscensionis]